MNESCVLFYIRILVQYTNYNFNDNAQTLNRGDTHSLFVVSPTIDTHSYIKVQTHYNILIFGMSRISCEIFFLNDFLEKNMNDK